MCTCILNSQTVVIGLDPMKCNICVIWELIFVFVYFGAIPNCTPSLSKDSGISPVRAERTVCNAGRSCARKMH